MPEYPTEEEKANFQRRSRIGALINLMGEINVCCADEQQRKVYPWIEEEIKELGAGKTIDDLIAHKKGQVKKMLDAGVDPNQTNGGYNNAFDLAVMSGDESLIKEFLHAPASSKRVPVEFSNHREVFELAEHRKLNSSAIDTLITGMPKLQVAEAANYAVKFDRHAVLKTLLEKGVVTDPENEQQSNSERRKLFDNAFKHSVKGKRECLDLCLGTLTGWEHNDQTLLNYAERIKNDEDLSKEGYLKKFMGQIAKGNISPVMRLHEMNKVLDRDDVKKMLLESANNQPKIALIDEGEHNILNKDERKQLLETAARKDPEAALEYAIKWELLDKDERSKVLLQVAELNPKTAYEFSQSQQLFDEKFQKDMIVKSIKAEPGFALEQSAAQPALLSKEQKEEALRTLGTKNPAYAFHLSHEMQLLGEDFQKEMVSKIEYNGEFSRHLFLDGKIKGKMYKAALQLTQDTRLTQAEQKELQQVVKSVYGIDLEAPIKEQEEKEKKTAPDKKDQSALTPLDKAVKLALDASYRPAETPIDPNAIVAPLTKTEKPIGNHSPGLV